MLLRQSRRTVPAAAGLLLAGALGSPTARPAALAPSQTTPEPITLSVASFTASPAAPRAGRTITAWLEIRRSDTGGRLTAGRPACRADVAGRAVPVRARGVRRRAYFCTWLVPRGTKGKVLAVEVSVGFADARIAKTFRKRIR